ncbi:MAG: PepSY domain-containing protein [Alphaproteobacteria bacterium]
MRWISVILVLFSLAFAPQAGANSEQNSAREAYQRGEILSLSVIRRNVLQRFNGQIISTRFQGPNNGGTYIYEFEIMSGDGGITEITVRATDAQVIRIRGRR